MPFWGWIVVGAILLAAETAIDAQFYLVFFGAAALVTGLVLAFGPLPVGVDWALFGVLSIAGTAAFRKRVYQGLRGGVTAEVSQGTVGELVIARESIPPGGRGRVELRGAMWDARNTGDAAIAAGERGRVVAAEGLVLELRRES